MMDFTGFDKNFSLDGKRAIVTGANSGIGAAIATLFIDKGASVAFVDRDERVKAFAATFVDKNAKGYVADLTNDAQLEAMVVSIAEDFGGIDVLVNCAGMGVSRPLQRPDTFSIETFDQTMAINLRAPFVLSRCVAHRMVEQGHGGRIINIASQAGVVAIEGHTAYTASKAGLIGLAKVFALELGKFGINCNCISPTVVMTDMSKMFWIGEVKEAGVANIPMARFAEPEEIAGLAAYLASDASYMINGANILIDGGYTIH